LTAAVLPVERRPFHRVRLVAQAVQMTGLSLRLTARQWATSTLRWTTPRTAPVTAARTTGPAQRIREAGWEQVPWVGGAKEWPPGKKILTITLRRDQWDLALRHLVQDHSVYEQLADEESLELG
jgi:hypothetical protein